MEARILITAKLPKGMTRVDVPMTLHITRARQMAAQVPVQINGDPLEQPVDSVEILGGDASPCEESLRDASTICQNTPDEEPFTSESSFIETLESGENSCCDRVHTGGEPLPEPKQWRVQKWHMKRPASMSHNKLTAKNYRRFNMPMDRTETLRACRAALSVFGFDFMQLGDRRVVCLKLNNGVSKLCLEITVNALSHASTEVCLLDYSRDSSCSGEAMRLMLAKMQQVIEQQAA
jgi:hypothetical protein